MMDAAQEASLATPQGSVNIARLMFPITVPAHCEFAEAGGAIDALGSWNVVCGHLYIWAWYLGMFQAMQAGVTNRDDLVFYRSDGLNMVPFFFCPPVCSAHGVAGPMSPQAVG